VFIGYHELRLAITLASGCINASATDRQAIDFGRRRSIPKEFSWKHSPSSGMQKRKSCLR